jgi:hypothetical protein
MQENYLAYVKNRLLDEESLFCPPHPLLVKAMDFPFPDAAWERLFYRRTTLYCAG